MKLVNYRCPKCGHEEEFFDDERKVLKCKKCKTEMKEFNFKNNKQRYYYCDPSK